LISFNASFIGIKLVNEIEALNTKIGNAVFSGKNYGSKHEEFYKL